MHTHAIHFVTSPDVSASIHDDGVVFLHVTDGCVFASNRTGAHIWQGLEQQLSTTLIAEHISRRYRISTVTAQADTARFIAQLEARHLVERRAA